MVCSDLEKAEKEDSFLELCDQVINGTIAVRDMLKKADHRLAGLEQAIRGIIDARRLDSMGTENTTK